MRDREKELEKYNYYIKKWYKGKRKVLTILSPPTNTSLIFKEIIEESLKNKEDVLYVWNGKGANKDLLKSLKIKESYSYLEKMENDRMLSFLNLNNYSIIKNKYNLCIIDDISLCELKNKNEVLEAFEHLFLHCDKIIIYSIEKLVFSGEVLEVLSLNRKQPFVEPRYITTRINLEEEIPYRVYEYFKWFNENKKKVVILISSEKKVNKIYYNYTELIESKGLKFNKYIDVNDNKIKERLSKEKRNSVFLLTNIIEDYKSDENLNFILISSEDESLSYKKIVYLCGKAGVCKFKPLGEVIVCSRELTKDMDKAKELCRSYNKNLWEKGLLKY